MWCWGVGALAADPWVELAVQPQDLVGTLSCVAASCHGGVPGQGRDRDGKGAEFLRWMGPGPRNPHPGSLPEGEGDEARADREGLGEEARTGGERAQGDPHAWAGWRMMQPRFREVLVKASHRADGSVDPAMADRCAACHDPMGLAARREASAGGLEAMKPVHAPVGIGCESCHGGARRWISTHFEAGMTREQVVAEGLIDTKDVLVRARVCASCHVGSAGRDLNHDMLAGGHPPLRFEQASYEALLRARHWDDRARRVVQPDYEFELWAAGRIAAASAALEVLVSRSREGIDPMVSTADKRLKKDVWPELSELSCVACHQDLKPSVRTRVPTSVRWQPWNVAFLDVVAPGAAGAEAAVALEREFSSSWFPDRQAAARHAERARQIVRQHAPAVVEAEGVMYAESAFDRGAVLRSIARGQDELSWDVACHSLAAVAAIRRALADRGRLSPELAERTREQLLQLARQLRRDTAAANQSAESLAVVTQGIRSLAHLMFEVAERGAGGEVMP